MTELEVIRAARRDLLVTRWQACFNVNPPPRVHTELLRRVLAWHVQVEATGQKVTLHRPSSASVDRTRSLLTPGTRLLREWRGITHEVSVGPDGFDYAGKTYKSLSAIARAITGTPWSGTAFFGIKR